MSKAVYELDYGLVVRYRSALVGNASSEIRMHVMGADYHGARSAPRVIAAREGGIIEALRLNAYVHDAQHSARVCSLRGPDAPLWSLP